MEAFVEKMIASYLDNTNSVLVTNLSVYVSSNSDLADLCRPYGNVTSADLAIDQESGYTGCFGFVTFATRDDAQNAINNLDGVQWLTPKTTS
jgi:RNA recognition motif-containing protein